MTPSLHLSVSIDRPAAEVYAYARDPANLPAWAAGLAGGIALVNGEWVADSPMGRVVVRFAEVNPFGVLDHDVTLPDGTVVRNPMRVVPNDGGSEITVTLFRRTGLTEGEFRSDARQIAEDLDRLARLLDGR